MATAAEELIKTVDEMSVLELNELVKALEEHYGVSAAAAAVPAAAAGVALTPARFMAEPVRDDVAIAFARALEAKPWLLAFATASRERFDAEAKIVLGQLPAGLVGTLFRNGPARHEIAGRRYHHWFDGDGLVQSFRFADGRVKHTARFVETEKLTRERAAGRLPVAGVTRTIRNPPERDSCA